MEKTFEFKKVNGKCAFIMKSDDIERTEVVSEEYAKKHYQDLQKQRSEMMDNLGKANKELEQNKVEHNDELEHFIELANKAQKYSKMLQAEGNQKAILKMVDDIDESIKAIENVMPEVKRAKKK